MNIIHVVIAEDNKSVRDGLRRILNRSKDILVVGEATDGVEAINQVEETTPDILILDIEMPRMNGFQVVEHFRSHSNPVKILVLSAYDILDFAINLLNNGICGYLPKEQGPNYLTQAVTDIASGQVGWLIPAMRQKIAVWRNSLYERIYMKPRQMQLLFLLIEGKNHRQIAEELGMSEQRITSNIQELSEEFGAVDEKDLIQVVHQPTSPHVRVFPSRRLVTKHLN